MKQTIGPQVLLGSDGIRKDLPYTKAELRSKKNRVHFTVLVETILSLSLVSEFLRRQSNSIESPKIKSDIRIKTEHVHAIGM